MDTLSRLGHVLVPGENLQSTAITITTALAVAASLLTLARRVLSPRRPATYPSPLKTLLPSLTPEEQVQLPYPPDFFPGARDVPTPYGSMRCYEFGPAAGRRVLLVHGISTSCMTLTHIARGLAARGCRVLLFDLFGRGYSDGVGDLPFDARLFVAQALLALASSEVAWMGGEGGGFHVLGYSLGGGIAVHLVNALPRDAVASLVLLAPAGMIREETFGAVPRIVFRSGWVPEGLLEILTRWRLKRPIAESARRKGKGGAAVPPRPMPGGAAVVAAVEGEIVDGAAGGGEAPNELQKRVLAFVNWQVRHHEGFVCAFMSTLRHAPMLNQHEAWKKLAGRRPKTTCFIFGVGDEIVSEEDYREDALPLVGGEEHVFWAKPVAGAHDFPMVHPEETLKRIWEFWGWE